MGEAAGHLPDDYPEPTHKAPLGALFDFEPEPELVEPENAELAVWPDLNLDLREKSIFGRKTISVTNESRLGSLIRSIVESAPQLNFVARGQTAEQAAVEARTQTEKFINERLLVNQLPKGEHDDVIEKIWADKFVDTNHPAAQALLAVHGINEERRARNEALNSEVYRDSTLTDRDIFWLKESFVLIFGSEAAIEALSQSAETEPES